ncbi:uncharacterized protein LY89DRAFT_741136 [Mollisia scopiformis]|uniref:Uncharacterized protein n=1 Tax=Mollisia scopiformis TaxID=149040 RepID=A0A132BAI6_MOLSC|nr:uncharacterized protein LY89DRAFT_741136 [Mollisia scopiformis]KUJ09425.1 hypothetical protein LY89DRAFT_741136 [Mollisia scopiformis]
MSGKKPSSDAKASSAQAINFNKDKRPAPPVAKKAGGQVYGLARRKGEKNPLKWGLSFEEGLLGHKALEGSRSLPPRDRDEYKVWKQEIMADYNSGKAPKAIGFWDFLFGGKGKKVPEKKGGGSRNAPPSKAKKPDSGGASGSGGKKASKGSGSGS